MVKVSYVNSTQYKIVICIFKRIEYFTSIFRAKHMELMYLFKFNIILF